MSDIVERLRTSDGYKVFTAGDGGRGITADTDLMLEAADEIAGIRRDLLKITGYLAGVDSALTEADALQNINNINLLPSVIRAWNAGLGGSWDDA